MLRRDFFAALLALLLGWLFPKKAEAKQKAVKLVNKFARQRLREDSFFRRITPPIAISNVELDRAVPTDAKLLDGAIRIPFSVLPANIYIHGPRYIVMFDRTLGVSYDRAG